jgi:hypothetical protein
MRKQAPIDLLQIQSDVGGRADTPRTYGDRPNRLMTAFEVAEFVGCHEETVHPAYLRGIGGNRLPDFYEACRC